jgi:ubiquinone/menaquinone biosynthesis C-methylase UbiE
MAIGEVMDKIIERIIPGAIYKKGFIVCGETSPFYSFLQSNAENSWSNDLTHRLEFFNKTHFIDVYNRKIALSAITNKLAHGSYYLDAGCSSGYMLEDVLNVFPWIKAIGTDYLTAGLVKCHNRLPNVPLFQMNLIDCQFSENMFDAVTCLNVLENIEDDLTALRELCRIIKPGGRLVITVPMGRNLYDKYDQEHYHVRRYEMRELTDKINLAGLKIINKNYFGVLIYPGFYFIKKMNRLRFLHTKVAFKKQIAFKQIQRSSKLLFMEKLCNIEYALGKWVAYPFGIRAYAICEKPVEQFHSV